ncbi:MAG: hypothetical protein WA434_16230 [Candidatus Acidiferrales bacterium]
MTGRKLGRTILLPVVVTIVDGQRYLVSMLGNDAQWMQTFVQRVEEQFSEAAVVRRLHSKKFPPTSVRPS